MQIFKDNKTVKLKTLVENFSNSDLATVHGLSFYIETTKHKILFDLGPDQTLFDNASKSKIDLTKVDIVIISHGHNDHGGALGKFLEINRSAKVFVQENAFEPYFNVNLEKIGLNPELKLHPQVILLNGDYQIDEELFLFAVSKTDKCHSPANDTLFDQNGKDRFAHEHSLLIMEEQTALIMGCGHTGIVNILDKAKVYSPKICIGGYHLYNPTTKESAQKSLLDEIAKELSAYQETKFYTCHCTGKEAFNYLATKMPNLFYLSCGDEIVF